MALVTTMLTTISGSGAQTFSSLTVSGVSDLGNLRVSGNTVSATNTNGDVVLTPNGSGQVEVGANSTHASRLRFKEDTDNGVNYTTWGAPASLAGDTDYDYPATYPAANGYALTSTTAGVTSWGIMGGRLVSFQVLTSGTAATYTKPAGVNSILVEAVGGGGAGAGATSGASEFAAGGGGGAGGYARLYVASAAATYTYTIGAGGTPGAAGNNAGGNGGATTFSASSLSAGGGTGGGAGTVALIAQVQGTGGAGGTSSNGDINFSGNPGGSAYNFTSGVGGGNGGSSHFGGGALMPATAQTAGAAAVANSGAGGAGGASFNAGGAVQGGAGGSGLIIVWEFT